MGGLLLAGKRDGGAGGSLGVSRRAGEPGRLVGDAEDV